MGWFENFFGSDTSREIDPDYSATIERIEGSLAGMPEKEARFLACVALLAARVAFVDSHMSEGEKQRITDVMAKEMKLSADRAKAVAELAIEAEASLAIEHHLVLRKMNEIASREQKLSVINTLFYVACDGDISEAESDKIGEISSALLLSRPDFLAIRAAYSEHRALLKGLPKK